MNERSDFLLGLSGQHLSITTASWLPTKTTVPSRRLSLSVVGLFAGIGGFEEGFHRSGHSTLLLCESDPAACRVLSLRFPGVELLNDIRKMSAIPECDVITAGFPCQDLSQVGLTKGITGTNSSLVNEVLRLLIDAPDRIKWLVLENVPFMLRLQKGRAIREITQSLSRLGWRWAYRTVDTRAFGLPQRRRRVIAPADLGIVRMNQTTSLG